MKITYDLEVLPERRRSNAGRKSEETLAIIAFLAGKQKNMRIEYDDPKECKRRYDTIRNYRRVSKLQDVIDLFKDDRSIYVIRLKKPGAKGKAAPGDRNTESGKPE